MTDEMMNLCSLVEMSANTDMKRDMIGFSAPKIMALDVGAATGAGYGMKTALRLAQRNGYRDRDWETWTGTVELGIPDLPGNRTHGQTGFDGRRKGGLYPDISTRSVDDFSANAIRRAVKDMGITNVSKS